MRLAARRVTGPKTWSFHFTETQILRRRSSQQTKSGAAEEKFQVMIDVNSIYDPGSSKSFSEVESAARYCDCLEIKLQTMLSNEQMMIGWGSKGLKRLPIVGVWNLVVVDRTGATCQFLLQVVRIIHVS